MLRGIVRGINGTVTAGLCVLLLLLLLIAGYALWDAYQLTRKADISSGLGHYQPTLSEEASNPTLGELAAINPDAIAWVQLENTRIDYPVLHGEDNVFYLNRDVYKEYSLAGSVFMDYRNSSALDDPYILLYGHNMDGGYMLADLKKYGDEAFFEENRRGYLFTTDTTYQLDIYAYLLVDAYNTPIFSMAPGGAAYTERLRYIQETAMHYRDIGITPTQQILVLTTCSSATTNDRSIVVAKMSLYQPTGGVNERHENVDEDS